MDTAIPEAVVDAQRMVRVLGDILCFADVDPISSGPGAVEFDLASFQALGLLEPDTDCSVDGDLELLIKLCKGLQGEMLTPSSTQTLGSTGSSGPLYLISGKVPKYSGSNNPEFAKSPASGISYHQGKGAS